MNVKQAIAIATRLVLESRVLIGYATTKSVGTQTAAFHWNANRHDVPNASINIAFGTQVGYPSSYRRPLVTIRLGLPPGPTLSISQAVAASHLHTQVTNLAARLQTELDALGPLAECLPDPANAHSASA